MRGRVEGFGVAGRMGDWKLIWMHGDSMPAPRGLVQQVDQRLHRTGLLPRGGKLLVAVSGGADSVALLRLLVEINRSNYWGWELVVGHVDHGMRGKASAGDAAFVRAL